MKRAYIPLGADQQGRLQPGQWLPRRVEPDFVDTYPTGPAPLPEAAHAASEHDDDFLTVNQLRERAANRIAALVFVVAVLCMVAFVASGAWK